MLRADGESTRGFRRTCPASGEEVKSGDSHGGEMPAFMCTSGVTFIGCKTHGVFLPHVQCEMFTESTFFTGGVNSVMSGFKLHDALPHTNTVPPFFLEKKMYAFFSYKTICGKH